MPTVLLVEDDFAIREVLAELLDERGFRVVSTADGREALSYLNTKWAAKLPMPAAIITDIHLPRMDGAALIQELQRVPEYAGIPVIVISGAPPDELAGLPVAAVFRKPLGEYDALVSELGRQVARSLTPTRLRAVNGDDVETAKLRSK